MNLIENGGVGSKGGALRSPEGRRRHIRIPLDTTTRRPPAVISPDMFSVRGAH